MLAVVLTRALVDSVNKHLKDKLMRIVAFVYIKITYPTRDSAFELFFWPEVDCSSSKTVNKSSPKASAMFPSRDTNPTMLCASAAYKKKKYLNV